MLGNITIVIIVLLFLLGSICIICSILFDPDTARPAIVHTKKEINTEAFGDLFMQDDVMIDDDLLQ